MSVRNLPAWAGRWEMMVCLSGGVVTPVPLLSFLQASICRCEPLRDQVAVCSHRHTHTHERMLRERSHYVYYCSALQEISVSSTHEMTACCVFLQHKRHKSLQDVHRIEIWDTQTVFGIKKKLIDCYILCNMLCTLLQDAYLKVPCVILALIPL